MAVPVSRVAYRCAHSSGMGCRGAPSSYILAAEPGADRLAFVQWEVSLETGKQYFRPSGSPGLGSISGSHKDSPIVESLGTAHVEEEVVEISMTQSTELLT